MPTNSHFCRVSLLTHRTLLLPSQEKQCPLSACRTQITLLWPWILSSPGGFYFPIPVRILPPEPPHDRDPSPSPSPLPSQESLPITSCRVLQSTPTAPVFISHTVNGYKQPWAASFCSPTCPVCEFLGSQGEWGQYQLYTAQKVMAIWRLSFSSQFCEYKGRNTSYRNTITWNFGSIKFLLPSHPLILLIINS